MSKLGCPCGAIIIDQTTHMPNSGFILRDKCYYGFSEAPSQEITEYFAAKNEGNEADWMTQRYGADYAELNLSANHVVEDIIDGHLLHSVLSIYQCENCGRVHIEDRAHRNFFMTFSPDVEQSDTVRSVLDVQQE